MLRKGPDFRIYVRWLDGQIARATSRVDPSFDDPDSFFINIKSGVVRTNIGDLSHFLNSGGISLAPLRHVTLSGDANQIKLAGTLHKIIPLPVEVRGEISAQADGRIRIHVTKLNVLKIPFKALLGDFHITVSDLFKSKDIAGLEVSGNDIILDTRLLLPPPHIRGHLTAIRVVNPDLEEVFGNAESDVARVEEWRNFLRLSGGTLDFGKLTMHHVDLVMIDISKDAWFDLDLANYQDQLVNGYTRMTPQAGLQIFMPDLSSLPPKQKDAQDVGIEWMRHRSVAPPQSILHH